MSPEEWHEVKALLVEALELPADRRTAWLDRRCGDDPALRRELEGLIAAAEDDGFLDAEPRLWVPAIAEGETLGPYKVERKLAEGGMGEVYQAFDDRLERRVAIKVLPAHLSDDASALRRFERETRALAALSHPNILTIFDVGRHAGTAFAVTELLAGATLRARLARGKLTVSAAVDVALQTARGLAAAHAAGIVHRDLKPENLFMTADGQVKVLDFGIAAFTSPRDTASEALTAADAVIGTAGYMSPEQAKGQSCDHRSDLFSLGAVLYELLAGAPAFPAGTLLLACQAVIDRDPAPVATLCPAAGPPLARLVHRCLEKEPARRIQSASDLAFFLETLAEPSPTPSAERPGGALRRRLWLAAPLAAVLGAAGVGVGLLVRPSDPPAPPRIDLLTHTSSDSSPAASPDGRTVAFVSERDGRQRIWLKQLATGDEAPLTAGVDTGPRFSPDGQMLLFDRDGDSGPGLYRVGLLGGEPQPVVSPGRQGAWSPDGRRVAFVREHSDEPRNGWSIGVAAADGSGERLFAAESVPIPHLLWSPDGRSLWAVRRRSAVGAQDDLLRLDVASGRKEAFAAPESGGQISRPAWGVDGRTLLFAQTGSVTGHLLSSRVVAFDPESGRGRTLFWFPSAIDVIESLGADRLVFDDVDASQNVGEAAASGDRFERRRWLTRGTSVDREPSYTPDGTGLVFSSNRSGNVDLWLLSIATGSLKRLTEDPADDWDPAFSPDGRLLLWSSNRNGAFEIFVAEADGRNPRQLTAGNLSAENPTATPDGEWVVYSADRTDSAGIRRARLDRTQDVLVTSRGRGQPEVSPDGRYVAFRTHAINDVAEVRVAEVESGAVLPGSVRLAAAGLSADRGVTLGRARWLPDGREVAYVAVTDEGCVALLARGFDPRRGLVGATRTLLDCAPDLLPESFGFAHDGRLAVSYRRRSSNLATASGLVPSELRP